MAKRPPPGVNLLVDPELEGAADEETEVAETDETETSVAATVLEGVEVLGGGAEVLGGGAEVLGGGAEALGGAGALVVGTAGDEVGSPSVVYGQTITALVTVTVVTTSG